jgi:RNA polymerase sigma factor (sigma-70 family)
MNISELVREAKQGSIAAEKCLFDLLSDKMLVLCRRYVKNQQDAEELLLNGFYVFFNKLPDLHFPGEAALRSWLKQVLINECLMFLRKKKVFIIVSESVAEDFPLNEDALNSLSAAEIFDLILQLPVGYRTVFNLYIIEGFSHREISDMLGITEGTSKSQLSKAKLLLQKLLMQKGIEYVHRKSK